MSPRRDRISAATLALTAVFNLATLAAAQTEKPREIVVRVPSKADSVRRDSTYRSRFRGRSLVDLLAEADSALKVRGGSHAENAQLYLSWNAPYGMKRAAATRPIVCADTTATDTLWLSFYPGRRSDAFTGFSAEIKFHSAGPDSLASWWHMESKGGENPGNMQVEFGPGPDFPGLQPWVANGQGFALLDRTPAALRLRTGFAVSLDDAGPIGSDTTYTLCRIILRHRRAGRLAGCAQPVCVEWASGRFGFALKDEPEVRRGERFVSWGASGALCNPIRNSSVRTWRPGNVRAR